MDVGDFLDATNWKAVSGTVERSDATAFRDDGSIRLACGHSDNRVSSVYRLPRPLDLRTHHLSFAFDYGAGSVGRGPTVFVQAPDTDNMLVYDPSHDTRNGWVQVPLASPTRVVGDPDLGRVQALTFSQWTGGGVDEELHVDALELVPRSMEPTVVFTFDDGRASVFDHAVPVLNQYDYQASTAVIPGRETNASFLSINQLGTLHGRGWDVMSHPQRTEALPTFGDAEQASLIESSKQWLLDRGFEDGSRFIVYPYSRWNRSTLELAAEHHELAFAGRGVSTWTPPMPMLVPRMRGDDPEQVTAAVDRLSTYGGVLVLMYHGINEEYIEPAAFRSVVSHVHETPDVQVRSVGQWYDEMTDSTT